MRPPRQLLISLRFQLLIVATRSSVLFARHSRNPMCLSREVPNLLMFVYHDSCWIFTLKARTYLAVIFRQDWKMKRAFHTPSSTPGLCLCQSDHWEWQMRGFQKHKAIHMLSGSSEGYLALIIRCRILFFIIINSPLGLILPDNANTRWELSVTYTLMQMQVPALTK